MVNFIEKITNIFLSSDDVTIMIITQWAKDIDFLIKEISKVLKSDAEYTNRSITSGNKKICFKLIGKYPCIGIGGINHLIFYRPTEMENNNFADEFASAYAGTSSNSEIYIVDCSWGIFHFKNTYDLEYVKYIEI